MGKPAEKNTIIRDVIHSDVEFDSKMTELIDTKELQRLHRIKQLSCEYFVFPTATHSRFSHSIGCYHVMKLLINHFKPLLEQKGYKVEEEDVNLALVSALVHDIGHGPFSHTFEKIFKIKSHEQWGIDILNYDKSEVKSKIISNYGEEFFGKLIEIISKNFNSKNANPIFRLISTLVSSQADADRMDYLLRDSYFTSVTNGNFDLQRLIKSFGVEEENNVLKIYINEKYMSTLEEYVLARYFMHKEVYQHSTKKQMEEIMKKIFMRASYLLLNGHEEALFAGRIMKKLLTYKFITVPEYLELDDGSFLYHINAWTHSDDEILKYLSESFLNRNKFSKNMVMVKNRALLNKLNDYLVFHGKDRLQNFDGEYYCLHIDKKLEVYAPSSSENILIKSADDSHLVDLTQKSTLINKFSIAENETKSLDLNYISPKVFELTNDLKFPENIFQE